MFPHLSGSEDVYEALVNCWRNTVIVLSTATSIIDKMVTKHSV